MILFIVTLGRALQCLPNQGCVPVPLEAIMEMARLGIIEMVLEVGVYQYYRKKTRK